nr:calcium-binding protein [Ruegeria sp. PrR005]
MSLQFQGLLDLSGLPFEVSVADLEVVEAGGVTHVLAATEAGGGLGVFRLSGGTLARFESMQSYGPGRVGSGVDLLTLETGGGTRVVPLGIGLPLWISYQLTESLGAGQAMLPGGSPIAAARTAVAGEFGGRTVVVALPGIGDEIATHALDATGQLAPLNRVSEADAGFTALALTAGGVLLAAGTGGEGGGSLFSYQVAGNGRLTLLDRAGGPEGPGFATPTALETLRLAGQDFAVLAAAGSASLSVFRVGSDGTLTATDHVGDTRLTRFDDATRLASARWGDWQFVLAAGADDGISLFALLPDGRLLHLDSLADSRAATLTNISALDAVVIGTELQVFTSSGAEPGISQIRADLSALGLILQGNGSGAELTGSDRNDVLISGGGADRLRGGGGADTFVFRPGRADAEGRLGRVLDFDPGRDRLDLSTLPFLYDIGQVTFASVSTGVILRFGALWVELTGASGIRLTPEMFTTGMILNAQHLPTGNVAVEDGGGAGEGGGGTGGGTGGETGGGGTGGETGGGGTGGESLSGDHGDNRLTGGAGNDVLQGHGGSDRLAGEAGNDTIDGGDGSDTINGGDGDDCLIGGNSGGDLRDIIYAGEGDDWITGGPGNDLLFGMGGNDTIAGDAGVDEIQGQDGDDVITGSSFSDLIYGGAGNDFVNGGFGHDRINGGSGADKFFHVGVEGHGSDWVQDFTAAEGDVLLFGNRSATRADFQVNFAHTENAEGERAGDDSMREAFVIYRPTGQIIWALVDGEGEGEAVIRLQIDGSPEYYNLLL